LPLIKEALGHDEETVHVDMLIYGRSGAGKTYRAATAPRPIYVLSPDPTGHKAIPFKVDGRVVRSIEDVRETVLAFRAGGHGYRSLIVDGLSFIHDLYVNEIGEYFHNQMGAKDPDLLPVAGRMKIQKRFRNLIRSLIDLTQIDPPEERVHVIFTTLEERLKESEEAPFHIRPLFGTQKMNEQFQAFFSIIAYITPSEREDENGLPDQTRYMYFAEKGGILARDKLNIFPSMGEAVNLSEYLK
jgi:hypothetical protein